MILHMAVTVHPPPGYPRAKLLDCGSNFSYWRNGHLFIKMIYRDPKGTYDRAIAWTLANEVEALKHLAGMPAIPHLADYREDGGIPSYVATEFIEGRNLGHGTLRLGPLKASRVAGIYTAAAIAINQIHDAGLVHGDIKPSNIMLSLQGVRIIDFGLTCLAETEGDSQHWLNGDIVGTEGDDPMGTAHFLAPEVGQFRPRSIKSDIYSFGCALYWTLVGEGPFSGDSPVHVVYAHINLEPPMPSSKTPGLDGRFDAIVARCLAKDPAERYARMSDVCADLLELADEHAAA